MRIRIITSHPALQHVLQRTAPVGIILRCGGSDGRKASATRYSIEMDLTLCSESRRSIVGAWLPPHVRHYGVDTFEIDGRTVGTESEMLRQALTQRGSPSPRHRLAS